MKKIITIILSLAMLLSLTCPAFAAEPTPTDPDIDIDAELATFAETYHITVDEIKNLPDNLSNALNEIGSISIDETVTVPISENLTLTLTSAETKNENLSLYTVSPGLYSFESTANIKNALGMTLATYTATGMFIIQNGTCSPSDGYGTYKSTFYDISNGSTQKGPTGVYSSYVRVSFSAQLKLGIDPISITLDSYSLACTLHMSANLDTDIIWTDPF